MYLSGNNINANSSDVSDDVVATSADGQPPTKMGRRVSTTGVGDAANISDGVADARSDAANARADVTIARAGAAAARSDVGSARLEVFEARVGVEMHPVKDGSAKVTLTNIPYSRFVGYELVGSPEVYVERLLEVFKDQSLENAEKKLENAKKELENAEQKLENAKKELENAKKELENAEQKLENAKKEAETKMEKMMKSGPEGDFESVLAQSEGFSLRLLDTHKAVDVVEFATFMKDKVENVDFSGFAQDSVAVVLRSASGVGKTFASLAMTDPLFQESSFDYFPIAVYIGLNSMCSLTSEEKHRLRDERSLERVLLRRLLIQLNYLASPKVNIDESLWDTETRIQKMPLPPKEGGWGSCKYHFSEHVSTENMQTKVSALLREIVGKVKKRIVLFPIVDEAQFLDDICPKDISKSGAEHPAKQGARWALRVLRNLQSNISQHKVLGLMTGIDPEVYLGGTDGKNECYGHPLHSSEGFKKITSALFAERRFSETQVARIAAVMYPHARELRDLANGRNSTPQEFEMDEKGVKPVRLLLASGSNQRIQIPWTQDVPAVFTTVDHAGPTLEFIPVLGIRHVAAVAHKLGGLPCSVDLLVKFALSPRSEDFESVTSFCLPMLLVLQNFELGCHKPIVRFTFIKKHVQNWLKVGFPVRFVQPILIEYVKLAYFPSSAHNGSHEKAFHVRGGTGPPLHKNFNLNDLEKCGDTVLMECSGDAPVDMIYVTLVRIATVTVKAKLQIRLCDAKLVLKNTNSVHFRMPDRFTMVKVYLEHHLNTEFDLDFRPFAIVTTSPNTTYPPPTDIVVISPTTCTFSPLTDMWFAT